ncbi:MAG: hypothetical protein ACR2O4_10115 [Hyphomicrobiaceae bacterium]
MLLKKIHLELARDPDFPNGSRHHGYEFLAPLDKDRHIDPAGWKKVREKCRVHRFWGDAEKEIGHLIRKPGGSWAFHYDIHGDEDDDETGHRFDAEVFETGEYVSIMEHDDVMRTFRVTRVTDAVGVG